MINDNLVIVLANEIISSTAFTVTKTFSLDIKVEASVWRWRIRSGKPSTPPRRSSVKKRVINPIPAGWSWICGCTDLFKYNIINVLNIYFKSINTQKLNVEGVNLLRHEPKLVKSLVLLKTNSDDWDAWQILEVACHS